MGYGRGGGGAENEKSSAKADFVVLDEVAGPDDEKERALIGRPNKSERNEAVNPGIVSGVVIAALETKSSLHRQSGNGNPPGHQHNEEAEFVQKVEVYTGYAWRWYVEGNLWRIAEERTKPALWEKLPKLLTPGTSCKITHLTKGTVIADGKIEKVTLPSKDTMTFKISQIMTPIYLLANMCIEIRPPLPFFVQEDLNYCQSLTDKLQRKNEAVFDPYPVVKQQQIERLLRQPHKKKAGDFVVHCRRESQASQRTGFKRLWISYLTKQQDIESFSVYLVEPSENFPRWIKWTGFISTLDSPWMTKDPNSSGVAVGNTLFESLEVFVRTNPSLISRTSPYLLKDIKEDQLMAINGYESESEEGYESEEEEGGERGDGVFIGEESKKKCCPIKQMIGIIFAIIALGAIGFGVWYVISRDNTAGNKNTIINQPAVVMMTTTPAPVDYGPSFHMTTILQGISTKSFETKEAKDAFISALRQSQSLANMKRVIIKSVDSVTRRSSSTSSSLEPKQETNQMSRPEQHLHQGAARRWLDSSSSSSSSSGSSWSTSMSLRQAPTALKIAVRTTVYVESVDRAKNMIETFSSALGKSRLSNFVSLLFRTVVPNATVTVMDVQDFSYSAGDLGTTAPYAPQITPAPSSECREFEAFNYSILVPVKQGEMAQIICDKGAVHVGNGSKSVECLSNGSFAYTDTRCEMCEAGKFASDDTCMPCPPGLFRSSLMEACEACPTNTFTSSQGQTSCTPCPPNSEIPPAADHSSESSCVCVAGTYTQTVKIRNGSDWTFACPLCDMGKYSERAGLDYCSNCIDSLANSDTLAMGSYSRTQCLCKPGYTRLGNKCVGCTNDFFKGIVSNDECTKCPSNSFTYANTSTSFADCICFRGFEIDAGSAMCLACPVGKYKARERGADALDGPDALCTSCAGGLYADRTNSTVCKNCPHGQWSLPGLSICSVCGTGQYSVSPASTCTACTAGKYAQPSSSSCIHCDPGSESPAMAAKCQACGLGLYNPESGGACQACALGKYTEKTFGSSACLDCNPGQVPNKHYPLQGGFCDSCLPGKYSTGKSVECDTCLPGSYSLSGASACTLCPNGTFSADFSASSCSLCGAGKFNQFLGATVCSECPDLTTTMGNEALGATHWMQCKCVLTTQKYLSSDGQCLGYWATGIQRNVSEAVLTSNGWTKCYEKPYSDDKMTRADLNCGDSISNRFAYGVKAVDSSTTLSILAMGSVKKGASSAPDSIYLPPFPLPLTGARPAGIVKNASLPASAPGNLLLTNEYRTLLSRPFESGLTQAVPQLENGVYWYVTANTFGFSPNSQVRLENFDMIDDNTCEDRVGWAFSSAGHRVGCRCTGCGSDFDFTKWSRVIYKHP